MSVRFGNVLFGFRREMPNVLKVSSIGLRTSSTSISSKTVAEALSSIKTKLNKQTKTRIFLGTGQYFTHEINERVIALSLGQTDSLDVPEEILDTGIPTQDLPKLEKEITMLPSCSALVTGEVDSVYEETWAYGFTNNPYFSIFSKFGYCLTVTPLKAGPAFRVYNGPLFEDIYLRNIQNFQVILSEEPWEERKLEVKLKNGEIITIVEDFQEGGSEDLGQLMTSTEWIVKAAGHLCLVARLVGNCKDVSLKLPDPLRAENNPWIELRNEAWCERANDSKDI